MTDQDLREVALLAHNAYLGPSLNEQMMNVAVAVRDAVFDALIAAAKDEELWTRRFVKSKALPNGAAWPVAEWLEQQRAQMQEGGGDATE